MLHRYLGMNILFSQAMVHLCTYRVWRLPASLGRALGSTRRRGEAQSRRTCQWSVSQHQQMGALVPIGDSRDRWRGSYRINFPYWILHLKILQNRSIVHSADIWKNIFYEFILIKYIFRKWRCFAHYSDECLLFTMHLHTFCSCQNCSRLSTAEWNLA